MDNDRQHTSLSNPIHRKDNVGILCDVCEKDFKSSKALVAHQLQHTDERPFTCTICDHRSKTRGSLKEHYKLHKKLTFKCSICGKDFNNLNNCRSHEDRHTQYLRKEFKCQVCEKIFNQRCFLNVHMRTHTGERPFVCIICGAAFADKSNLRKHNRIHTGERPFKCSICGKGFNQGGSLTCHMRSHNTYKPFGCQHCGKCFGANEELIVHLRVHGEKHMFKCNACDTEFNEHSHLKSHQRLHTYHEHKTKKTWVYKEDVDLEDHNNFLRDGGTALGLKKNSHSVFINEDSLNCSADFSAGSSAESCRTQVSAVEYAGQTEQQPVDVLRVDENERKLLILDRDIVAPQTREIESVYIKVECNKDRSLLQRKKRAPAKKRRTDCDEIQPPETDMHMMAEDLKPAVVWLDKMKLVSDRQTEELNYLAQQSLVQQLYNGHDDSETRAHYGNSYENNDVGIVEMKCVHKTADKVIRGKRKQTVESPGRKAEEAAYKCHTSERVLRKSTTVKQENVARKLLFKTDRPAKSKTKSTQHIRKIYKNKEFICSNCPKRYAGQKALDTHALQHLTDFRCTMCSEDTLCVTGMLTHMRTNKNCNKKRQPSTLERTYECTLCDKKYNRLNYLTKHMLTHTSNKPFQCDYCKVSFSSKYQLKAHIFNHVSFTPFSCDHCDRGFGTGYHLNKHMLCHTQAKPFRCDECSKCFKSNGHLSAHKKIHLNDSLACMHCGKTFKVLFNLKAHESRHLQTSDAFACTICAKKFRFNSELVYHMRTHTGEKPYKCNECNACFAIGTNLRKHQRIHSGAKPYKCDVCDRKFNQRCSLNSHKKTHSTQHMPFECVHCGKFFASNEDVTLHLRQHDDAHPFKCNACDREFAQLNHYKSHRRLHNSTSSGL